MKRLFITLVLSFFLISCENLKEAERLFDTAISLWEEKEYDESIQHFITLTKSYPSSHLVDDSLYFIANIYHVHLKEKKQAIRYYRYLNKKFSDSEFYESSLKKLAALHSDSKKDFDQALVIYQTIQEMFPESPNYLHNQLKIAQLAILQKKYEVARADLKNIIETEKDHKVQALAYYSIGFSYYQEGKKELAELAYRASQTLGRNGLEKWYPAVNLAGIYEEKGQLKKSINTLNQVLQSANQDELMRLLVQKRIKKIQSRLNRI